jgi:hypothetical protein
LHRAVKPQPVCKFFSKLATLRQDFAAPQHIESILGESYLGAPLEM